MHATKGNRVKIHYTGTLQDGTVFDSSLDREPLEFVIGAGQMIAGFDQGVEGMTVGEERVLVLPPEKAYGLRDEERIFQVSRNALPEGYEPTVGDQLHISTNRRGRPMRVVVAEVGDEHLLLDGNHHLAGKELTFSVKLVEIAAADQD